MTNKIRPTEADAARLLAEALPLHPDEVEAIAAWPYDRGPETVARLCVTVMHYRSRTESAASEARASKIRRRSLLVARRHLRGAGS